MEEVPLEQLLKTKRISQKTFDRVTVAKEYIERKYNLKSIINSKWNNIIDKINTMNLTKDDKNKIIEEINHQETQKIRKDREKQTIRDYESLAIIGRGAFGEVHVCREKKTGNIVAIKKMKKETLVEKNQIIHIRSEQLFMSKVKSPWIVDLKASFQEDDYLYLVMEFLPGGDLMSLLIQKDILTENEARFYTAELILAVESIHKFDCIHRDIKPDNILIDKNGHIKLSDFGLAKVSDRLFENQINKNYNPNKPTHQKNYSCVGTAYYVAPEVLNKKGYGKDIDWWSVGVIFFEMLCGYAPFCSEETKEVCYKVLNWEKYLKIPDEVTLSKEAEDFITKMINNQNKRLGKNSVDEIKSHPFFKGVDWENIRNTKAPFIPDIKNDYDTKYFEKFESIEPFYPPIKKLKKRKDIEYLGYTYRDGDEEKANINWDNEYADILEKAKKISDENEINNINNIKTNNNNNIKTNLCNSKDKKTSTNKTMNIKISKINNKVKGVSPIDYNNRTIKNLNSGKKTNIIQKPLKLIKINNNQEKYNTNTKIKSNRSFDNNKGHIRKLNLNGNSPKNMKLITVGNRNVIDQKNIVTSLSNPKKKIHDNKNNKNSKAGYIILKKPTSVRANKKKDIVLNVSTNENISKDKNNNIKVKGLIGKKY